MCERGGARGTGHTCLITIGRHVNIKHQQLTQQETTSCGSAEALIGRPVARCIFSLHRYGNKLRFFTPSTEGEPEGQRRRRINQASIQYSVLTTGGRQIHQISIVLMVLLLVLVLVLVFVSVLVQVLVLVLALVLVHS